MRALFDVNVLIALLDPDHPHHLRAQAWWKANRHAGWATCPLSENGFVRVMSNAKYPADTPFTPQALILDLGDFISRGHHAFWPDDISLLDAKIFNTQGILGPRQLTDIYLLALAVRNGGRLVSFDSRISTTAVKNATAANLNII